MSDDEALAAAWRQQATWSAVADSLKNNLQVSRRILLAALVASSVLAAAATWLGGGSETALGVAAAIVLIVVPLLRRLRLSRHAFSEWTRARSASEALKHEVYTYLSGTGPYRGTDRGSVLSERVAQITRRVDHLGREAATVVSRERPLPAVASLDDYLKVRVEGQVVEYYEPNAALSAERAHRLETIETVMLVVGGLLILLVIVFDWREALGAVGVVTTIGGAVLAHLEGERYEHLATMFGATARRLESLRAKWLAKMGERTLTPAEEDLLVDECEAAISVENQAWMAAWA